MRTGRIIIEKNLGIFGFLVVAVNLNPKLVPFGLCQFKENDEEKLLDFEEKKEKLSYGNLQNLLLLATFSILFLGFELPGKIVRFFVLSGYLMCLLLSKTSSNKNQSIISKIVEFYQRRLCRILPNYYFLILINIFLLIFSPIFPETFIETNQKSAKQSIFFVSNDFSNLEDDYYILLKIAENLFTHTWSKLYASRSEFRAENHGNLEFSKISRFSAQNVHHLS
ncbi:unnamed protein product [Caenorhabditis angaria]|uniref:Uncharacterized protein n=1 Tax=Caenorhabditis angaria TaxID=860376 RepID=A0A9P1IR11_9PELO|nr:unnamed protein product [Caenorhabditis angaria]